MDSYLSKYQQKQSVINNNLLPYPAQMIFENVVVFSLISSTIILYIGTHAQLVNGLRVVRGPNWSMHRNEDGGEGCVGTVVKWKETWFFNIFSLGLRLPNAFFGMVSVIWDSGIKCNYRIGFEGDFDLRVRNPQFYFLLSYKQY